MPHDRVVLLEYPLPDLGGYRVGNTGIDYVSTFDSGCEGPHVVLNALTHGNELCGAVALVRLLELRLRPQKGRLTLVFANVAAFHSFDAEDPFAARFLDEDFNRLWADDILDTPMATIERNRARSLRPLYRQADVILDLHSMSRDRVPLLLCGATARGRALARRLGYPAWVVADAGHQAGQRLIDYGPFSAAAGRRTALLVECGQHWRAESGRVALEACLRLLLVLGMIDPAATAGLLPERGGEPVKVVEVTDVVTARTSMFSFRADCPGLTIIPRAGTVIGDDGLTPIATPYDDCVLIMPTLSAHSGQTIVRLGRIVA